ncbi:MAG: DnaD domain protein [Clostridiales bacterium]|nr:DnaD domain protein [Clostridiales bacterium]
MAKTKLKIGEEKDIFLHTTKVENLFINEFLPGAPGDYVKVFLFGLMYAQYNQEVGRGRMARALGISEEDIVRAWQYWADEGIVTITKRGEDDSYEIEYVRQIDNLYGRGLSDKQRDISEKEEISEEDSNAGLIEKLVNKQIKYIFDKYQMQSGRIMTRKETEKLTDAIKVYGIEPDVLAFAIDYCADLDKYSVDYIFKVALRWTEEGCRDISQVKENLDRYSKRNADYATIFKTMGFTRLPNPADRELMSRWFDEMGFTIKEVIEACKAAAGLREPNLRYVNKVLENKMLEKGGIKTSQDYKSSPANTNYYKQRQDSGEVSKARVSKKVLRDYYDYLRSEASRCLDARIDEVCARVPEMREIFASENAFSRELLSLQMGKEGIEKRQELRNKRKLLEENKKGLLKTKGYPEDYLEEKYKCDICKDSGFTDEGRVCTCSEQRAEEAYRWIQETSSQEK